MRTKTLLLTAALSAAGVASSMAQGTVFSVNAVGYVNTVLKPKFNLVANPLTAADNSIAKLFAGVPFGTQVYKFNPATVKFDIATNDDLENKFVPDSAANLQVLPGDGVFVRNPGTTDLTVTFVGEVAQGTSLQNPIPKGLSIKSSMVPQEGKITADLAFPGKPGDQVFKFDAVAQKYAVFGFDDLENKWTPTEPVIGVGEAFFVRKANADTWTRSFSVNQ
jgi:hypothetical protein